VGLGFRTMATTITVGRELQMTREVARVAYRVGREVDRTDLLKLLKKLKKKKYRKLGADLRVLAGLALTDQAGYVKLKLSTRSRKLD
jgi:hypothetical protein